MSVIARAPNSRADPPRLGATTNRQRLVRLLVEVDELLASLSDAESRWSIWLAAVAPEHRPSARTWFITGQYDNAICEPCGGLAAYGLSSLGRIEPHVEATLFDPVGDLGLFGDGWRPPEPPRCASTKARTAGAPNRRAADRPRSIAGPRIMVTLPSAAATDQS